MSYIKQTVIIKQREKGFSIGGREFSGICKVESEQGVATVHLTLINFSAIKGEYQLLIADSNISLHTFPLGETPMSSTFVFDNPLNLDMGFFAVLLFNEQIIGCGSPQFYPYSFAEIEQKIKSITNKEREEPPIDQPETYFDEAVATENYYDKSDVDIDNLSIKSDYSDIAVDSDVKPLVFYQTVEQQLKELFYEYEEEKDLMRALPNSRFVKIHYSSDKYYVTGVIYNEKTPKYICYGVPSAYQTSPPKSLDGVSCFVPLSVFEPRGKGYYIIFQDASTGKCVYFKK